MLPSQVHARVTDDEEGRPSAAYSRTVAGARSVCAAKLPTQVVIASSPIRPPLIGAVTLPAEFPPGSLRQPRR